jgi:CPA1 family monovalent cation:H+ antiporter
MELIETTLLVVLAVALVGALSRRLPVPLPMLLVAAGVVLSYAPGLRDVELEPSVFFLLFIPPLLFSDAWLFPKREFFQLRYSILLLAFGLVFATTLVVGYVVHWLIPSIPLAAAFALGAIVSPTDAVAVSEITHKLKLPHRLTAVLNGESLVNDASGLVAFKFAVAAVVTGAFSFADAAGSFVLLAGGGVIVGLGVALVVQSLRHWLQRTGMEEPSVQIALSLLTPFAAYVAAEAVHVSGVLAVVAAGLYAGSDDNRHLTLQTRLSAWTVWETVLFLLNGAVFLLLGLELRRVLAGIADRSWGDLALYALIVSGTVIVVRLLWMYPGARLAYVLNRRHAPNLPPPGPRGVFIAAWAGVRGAVTLAGALSLPLMAGDGPFPERGLLIFLATSVILVTLALNGLSLPLLIRVLGIRDDGELAREERSARIELAHAAVDALRTRLDYQQDAVDRDFTLDLIRRYERRALHDAGAEDADTRDAASRIGTERDLRLAALAAERERLAALRDARRINESVLFTLQRELDLEEATLHASGARAGVRGEAAVLPDVAASGKRVGRRARELQS